MLSFDWPLVEIARLLPLWWLQSSLGCSSGLVANDSADPDTTVRAKNCDAPRRPMSMQ